MLAWPAVFITLRTERVREVSVIAETGLGLQFIPRSPYAHIATRRISGTTQPANLCQE